MQTTTHKAFTLVELIFVIIIIGILSGVVIPKFAKTSEEAYKSRAESVVHALRSVIVTERQKNILKGRVGIDINTTKAAGLLSYGLDSSWAITDADTFTYTVPGGNAICAFDIVGSKLVKKTCDAATGLDDL